MTSKEISQFERADIRMHEHQRIVYPAADKFAREGKVLELRIRKLFSEKQFN